MAVGDFILTEGLQGFRDERDFDKARKLVTSLTIVSLGGREIAIQAAKNFRALRKAGVTVRKTVDTVIATWCIESGYALLHCDLEAGHDPPHMALARGYRRPVRWVRDDSGIAHPVPDPATGAPVVSPVTQPSPAPQAEPPRVSPLTGAGP